MHEFETFETGKFVSRLLGKGDWNSFIERVQVPSSTTAILRVNHATAGRASIAHNDGDAPVTGLLLTDNLMRTWLTKCPKLLVLRWHISRHWPRSPWTRSTRSVHGQSTKSVFNVSYQFLR